MDSTKNLVHKSEGYYIKKKIALFIAAGFGLILIGVILATYFGTKATFSSSNSTIKDMTKPTKPKPKPQQSCLKFRFVSFHLLINFLSFLNNS